MKKFALLALLGVCGAAQAAINFNLDIPDQVIVQPGSTTTVVFTGTVDVTSGWDAFGASMDFPYLISSTTGLSVAFTSSFTSYMASAAPGVDYAGSIFEATVNPTDPVGLYGYAFNSINPSEIVVSGSNGVSTFNDSEAYSVEVVAVPEPATLAVLGLGAAALIRRRRK